MRKALFAQSAAKGVICTLCERECLLGNGQCGNCGVRECSGGELRTRAVERVGKVVPRPIEALGLYHVLPASRALTVAFAEPEGRATVAPSADPLQRTLHSFAIAELPDVARRANCASVAFGYVEPTYYIEPLVSALDLVRRAGLCTIVQTSAGMSAAAAELLAPKLDVVSVNVATLVEATARRIDSVSPHVLRENLARLRHRGVWIEASTVLEPGVNDSDRELLEIALSLKAIDGTVPWHVRCIPQDEGMLAKWAERAIERALEAGSRAGLEYVYTADAPGSDRELTFCHVCSDVVLIERFLGQPRNFMAEGIRCPRCRTRAHGLFHARARAVASIPR